MEPHIGDTVSVATFPVWTNVNQGSADLFGYRHAGGGTWTPCRETAATGLFDRANAEGSLNFAYHWRQGFHDVPIDAPMEQVVRNIQRLLTYLEDRMGWWHRSQVHWCDRENTCYIYASGGWMQNFNAISLLTLFVRVGTAFDGSQEFHNFISPKLYAAQTLPAIYRFLEGYQHYTGHVNGWYAAFVNKSAQDVRPLLIRRSLVEWLANALWENHGSPSHQDESVRAVIQKQYWLDACNRLRYPNPIVPH